ncbi:MAG TPA: hypothetical protein VGC39_06510, partial [Candidatus Methylacidiphilales bacterium]
MNALPAFVAWPFRQFTRFTQAVIGDIAWRPPGWARTLQAGVVRRPVISSGTLLLVILLASTGCWIWNWYARQPKPPTVDWTISSSPGYYRQPLTLTFDRSIAALEFIGKDVSSQVELSPKLSGKWIWAGGTQLVFVPAADWSAATTYNITLSKQLFSRHVRIETLEKSFRTRPFSVVISAATFYVNPKDPSVKQVTATLNFTYPVDRASLEKNLALAMESGEQVFHDAPNETGRCAITYDPKSGDCVAYLRSVNVAVPKESGHAILTVPESVRTASGGAALDLPKQADVLVPSTTDLFYIASAKTTIVTTPQGDPEQTLIVATSVGVKPGALARSLRAWILPTAQHHVDSFTGKSAEGWDSAAQVDADVLAKAKLITLAPEVNEEEFATLHSFHLKVPENAWIYLEIAEGLEATGGFSLGHSFTAISQVPPYPRAVQIMHEGSLLALNGERKLSILSRGVQQLEFRLERVTPSSINHLVSQSEGNFQSPVFDNYNFDETNIAEQIIRRQNIAGTEPSRNDYSALDFSEFVNGGDANRGKLGLFILRVLGRKEGEHGAFYKQDGSLLPDPLNHPVAPQDVVYHNGEPQDPTEADDVLADRRLILVTDLGLLIKDNADGTHDVFVQSIKTGEPVGGAQVDVLGKNGIAVVTVKTDDTGRATLPSLQDFTREKKPVAYVVRRDEDVSFLPFGREDRELNFSRFDTAGVTGLAAHDLTAFVFTDRGIYRPGDEAKLGLIVKQRDWQGKLDGVP